MRTEIAVTSSPSLSAESRALLSLIEGAQCVLQLGASSRSSVDFLAALSHKKEVALVESYTPLAKQIKLKLPHIRVSNSPVWKILDTYRPAGRAAVVSTLTPPWFSAKKRKYFLDSLQLLLEDVPNCVLFQTSFGITPPFSVSASLEWAAVGWTHRYGLPRCIWALSSKPKPLTTDSGFAVGSALSDTQFHTSVLD